MIITCSSCNSRYRYDESKLAGAASKRIKCPKCKGVIEVLNPILTSSNPSDLDDTFDSLTKRPAETSGASSSKGPSTVQVHRDAMLAEVASFAASMPQLKMPDNKRFSLAVLSGNNSGEIFHITKPLAVIGRSDADMVIRDVEASRQHARVEIMGDRVVLRDLNSTNGTFVDEKKVGVAHLDNQSEFRIGTTVFMLIITDID